MDSHPCDQLNKIANYNFSVFQLLLVLQESLQDSLLWAVCNHPPATFSLLNDPCVLTVLSCNRLGGVDDMVLQFLHTLLTTRHEPSARLFLHSEKAWRSFQKKATQTHHLFQFLLAFIFHSESILSPTTFALLYWACPSTLIPYLVRWLLVCYPNPMHVIHKILFNTASFPPPLQEIALPLWQTTVGGRTVFQAYVCGTIDLSCKSHAPSPMHFPIHYLKPSLDTFCIVESFWHDLTQWVCLNPHSALSLDFWDHNEWSSAPDMLFVLLDQVSSNAQNKQVFK